MATTDTTARRDAGIIREGALRGCAMVLIATPLPDGGHGYLVQLDRTPATYCRSLTPAELATLARLNPDDGVPDAALSLLADLSLALTTLDGRWQGVTYQIVGRAEAGYAATFRPVAGNELGELSRVASDLLAALREVAR